MFQRSSLLRRYWPAQRETISRYSAGSLLSKSEVGSFNIPPGKTLAITGGMYSAATTWTFNLLRNAWLEGGYSVFGSYAKELNAPLLGKLRDHDVLVVKSHVLGAMTSQLVRKGTAQLCVPVRDPRDAICSLINRFGYSFPAALRAVAACADNIVELQIKLPHLALRYEDRFTDDVRSVKRICQYFGRHVTEPQAKLLYDGLRPEKVQSLIVQLEQEQSIIRSWLKHSVDDKTNWHPNHVGDMKIGKYRSQLSPKQLAQTNQRLGKFIEHFGY